MNAAVKRKDPYIEVQGDLVRQIKWMERLSPAKTAALVALLASTVIPSPISPISAVVSMPALATITGGEIAGIIIASGLSITLILAVLKGYDVTIENDGKSVRLTKK